MTPPVPATVVDHDEVRRLHGYHRLRVARVVEETADARSYVLDVPDELREAFRYRPGQFCTFRARVGDDEHLRCYSMSSAPETDDDLVVTVKRVPGGLVSNWFHDAVSDGDVLEVTRPAGVFGAGPGPGDVVAFCGGSGVTPVMSVAKSVLASTDRRVRLLYANRDAGSVIFRDALDRLGERHGGRLEVRHHLDAEAGFLDADAITRFAAASPGADVLVCGPGPFMDLVEGALLRAGVDPARIAIERFDNPAAVPAAPPGDAGAPADDAEPAPADDATRTVTLVLRGTRTTVDYRPGDTLLETARRGGLAPPFSCEAGNCATCMAVLHEGSATMRANNALTPDEVAGGWVLTCQALPRGRAVTVEYEDL